MGRQIEGTSWWGMQCLRSNSRQQSGWEYPSVTRSVVPDKFTEPIRTRSLPPWGKGPPWFLPYNSPFGIWKWAFFFFLTFCIEDGFRRWWVWLLESRSGQRHEGSHGSCWESFGWCGSSGVYPSYCVFGFLNRIMGFNRLANPCICSNISSRSSPLNFAPWTDRR